MLTVATWNVNSVKSRLPHVLSWLKESAPDIALLQETKVENDGFPRMEIEELGYNLALCGQKTYNGVAILSKFPLDDIRTTLPGDHGDTHARYIEAVASIKGAKMGAIRVASVYVPNGQQVGSDKFDYKLRFFERLRAHAEELLTFDEAVVFGGDYNVAPEPIDVYNPQALDGTVCFHPLERGNFRALRYLGYYDAYRALHPTMQHFSWWDYRAGAFEHNRGMRLDHLLLSPLAADALRGCAIEDKWRTLDKPSDHTPVQCNLDI